MKIAIIANSGIYPINIGGPANVGYYLAKEFGKSGNNVTLFVRVKDKKEFFSVRNNLHNLHNVNIIPFLIRYDLKTFVNIPSLISKIIIYTYQFSRKRYDVVLYNSPPVDISLLVPFISKLYDMNQFLIIHGGLFNESKNFIGRLLIRLQIRYFKKIIAISHYSKDIVKKLGVDDRQIVIINNGIDLSKYNNLSELDIVGDPKLLYVGRLQKIKGVDILIRAFSIIHKLFPNSYLYIVGDGGEKNNLISITDDIGIRKFVNFVGYIPPSEQLYRYYISCNILILPSHIENFPITLLEAMFFKIPIIATKTGGITDLMKDRINGLLVKPGDHIELAKSIANLYNNKKMQIQFIEYNKSLIEKYSWNTIIKKYIDLFKKNMGSK